MTKKLAVLVCLLGIVSVSMPALASPTDKKITLTCTSLAPDVISANATVTLCAADLSPCGGAMFACPTVACDSAANPSMTISCAAPFRVDAVAFIENFTDINGSTHTPDSGTRLLGKGGKVTVVSVQVSTFDVGDTAVLEVK